MADCEKSPALVRCAILMEQVGSIVRIRWTLRHSEFRVSPSRALPHHRARIHYGPSDGLPTILGILELAQIDLASIFTRGFSSAAKQPDYGRLGCAEECIAFEENSDGTHLDNTTEIENGIGASSH